MTSSPPPPARRLSESGRRKLNEMLAERVPMDVARQRLALDPEAFEPVVPAAPSAPAAPAPRPPWTGDRTDWGHVVERMARLRALDPDCKVSGAHHHRHQLGAKVPERQLLALEKKLGVALPPGLRAFYATVGDGGAGPDFGLYPFSALKRHRPATPYPGVAALRAIGARTEPKQPPDPRHAFVSSSRFCGMITLLTSGCSLYSAVVCAGDVGRIIHYDDDRIVETDDTLVGWYDRWLDEQLARLAPG